MWIKHGYKLTYIDLDELDTITCGLNQIVFELTHRQEVIETSKPDELFKTIEEKINNKDTIIIA